MSPRARGEISAAYRKMDAATLKGSVAGVMAYYPKSYICTYKNGTKFNYDQLRLAVQQQNTMVKALSVRTHLIDFSSQGSRITVLTSTQMVGLLRNRPERVKIEVNGVLREVWVNTSAGWRCQKSESLGFTSKINGRAIDTGM